MIQEAPYTKILLGRDKDGMPHSDLLNLICRQYNMHLIHRDSEFALLVSEEELRKRKKVFGGW